MCEIALTTLCGTLQEQCLDYIRQHPERELIRTGSLQEQLNKC